MIQRPPSMRIGRRPDSDHGDPEDEEGVEGTVSYGDKEAPWRTLQPTSIRPATEGSIVRFLTTKISALIGFLLFNLGAHAAGDGHLAGKVVRIIDGDTVVVEAHGQRHRIHLAAIQAPEQHHPWGEASTRSMRRILAGQQVIVDSHKEDCRGDLVGYVRVSPMDCPTCGYTLDAGLYQLTVGMARHFGRHADEQTPEQRGQYEFAEFEARAKKAGLWSDPDPAQPWDERRSNKH